MTDVGRRAFLGVAAMAPIVAPAAAQMAMEGPMPTPAYPVNASMGAGAAMGQVAERMLGPMKMPWVMRGLTEEAWKTLQSQRRALSMQLEALYSNPNYNIRGMKSWSEGFRASMERLHKLELQLMLDEINAKLEKGSLLDPA